MSQTITVDDAWLDAAGLLCGAARGNDRFVKVRAVARLLSAWAGARALAKDTTVAPTIDTATGLPPWTVWADLHSEQRQGQGLAAPMGPIDLEGTDARARLARREAAARALAAVPPLTLEAGRVDLRRVEAGIATLAITLDQVTASGLLVRLSADISVAAGGKGSSAFVIDDADRATTAAPVIALLQRSAQLPAPAVAVQLAAMDGVRLHRLTRGVVGPLTTPHHPLPALSAWAGDDGAMVVLSFEELGEDVAAIADNDLFASDDLRELWGAMPADLQRRLRVFRDARVVASPPAAVRVHAAAAHRGLHTVVTTIG